MDWTNERYVRLYTRDTPEWLCLDWQGRALWPLLIRKVDRSGVLANRLGARGVSVLVGLPVDVVEVGLASLLADGCLQEHQLGFVIPNFLEAQETAQSNAQRKRESREARRVVTKRDIGSRNVTECHAESQEVTDGHSESQTVTPIRAEPILSDPSLDDPDSHSPRAIPPAPVPSPVPSPVPAPEPFDLTRLRAIGLLAEATWKRVSEARIAEAERLGLVGVQPFPRLSPAKQPRSFDELRARIREEGDRAPVVVEHVIAHLVEQARDTQSIEWLSEKAFLEGSWRTARESIPGGKRTPQNAKARVRDPTVGRVEPLRPEDYPTGDIKL